MVIAKALEHLLKATDYACAATAPEHLCNVVALRVEPNKSLGLSDLTENWEQEQRGPADMMQLQIKRLVNSAPTVSGVGQSSGHFSTFPHRTEPHKMMIR